MDPLGHGAVLFRHLGDLREHVLFPRSLVLREARLRLQLSGALPHRGFLLGRESLRRRAGGSLGGLPRRLLGAHRSSLAGSLPSSSIPLSESGYSCSIRRKLPAGSRTAPSRTPQGCSTGSCTTSVPGAPATFSKVASRSSLRKW